MSDQQISVGAELARAREAAGMTTAQVSDATRVRRTIIEAIERGDLSPAGGIAYARGHIRAMCAILGLDPVPLLARLDEPTVAQAAPHADPAVAPEAPAKAPDATRSLGGALAGAGTRRERTGPNWSGVMAGALVLVVAVAVVQVVRSASGSAGPSPVAAPTVSASSPSEPGSGSEPTTPTPPTGPAQQPPGDPNVIAQADGVDVVLSITGRASWVSASTAKGTVFEGTLTKGDHKVFKDRKKIRFVFGNAGSVNLQVNGVDIGAPGQEGQVVKASFVPGDPTQAQA